MNNYFQFKKFTIYQDQCAMKVGTDGVILGSWCPVKEARKVLDIGTGTGLLALMIAQRQPQAAIDAVEIDRASAQQAQENATASPWASRLRIIHASIQQFANENKGDYDLIVCNPPYFINSLTPPNKTRSLARHCHTLTHNELANCVDKLLSEEGIFALILPVRESELFLPVAETYRLFCNRQLFIHPTPEMDAKRRIMLLSRTFSETTTEHLTIKTSRHNYTEAYRLLTKDFYLNF